MSNVYGWRIEFQGWGVVAHGKLPGTLFVLNDFLKKIRNST